MMGEKPDLEATLHHYGADITGLHGNRLILCVVHDEQVPSLSVNLDKGLMLCHSCGFRGDSINLIMEKEGLGYAAALEWSATHLGFTRSAPAGRSHLGLSGEARPARGGYRPAVRRRPGLARS